MNLPKVDEDKCTGCGVCIEMCASDAIVIENGRAHIFTDKCCNCGVCERTCPVRAIS